MTPTLTPDVSSPTDGDTIILTCATTTGGITSYEFKRGTTSLATSSAATYTITTATIGTDDDSYTCIAYIDTVASDPSIAHTVACELFICLKSLLNLI